MDNFLEISSWNGINVQEIQTWLCIKLRIGIFGLTKQRSCSSLPMTYPWASGDLLLVGGKMATKCKKDQHGTHAKLQFAVCDIGFSEGAITPTSMVQWNMFTLETELIELIFWASLAWPNPTRISPSWKKPEIRYINYKPINLKHQLTRKIKSKLYFCQATKASFLARHGSTR